MTNPIVAAPVAQTNTASTILNGLTGETNELASPGPTFVDFLIARIDANTLSQEEISAITKDLSSGEISKDSPIFNIIGKLTEQFNLEQNSKLSAGNELFIRELAGLFVDLNQQGDINLSNDIVEQLSAISAGEAPAEEFVALIQSTDLFAKLREAIQEERAHGLAKIAAEPEDLHEIATEKVEEILSKDPTIDESDIGGIEIVLKRLENILANIRARIAQANNPRSEEALTKVAEKVANLIARFENKLESQAPYLVDDLRVTLNKDLSAPEGGITIPAGQGLTAPAAVAAPVEGFSPTRHALLKAAAKGKAGAVNTAATPGVTLNVGTASAQSKAKGKSFSLTSVGVNNEAAWLSPVEGDISFDPKLDAKAIAADQLQNTVRAAKSATTQSNARLLLPASPAAQQVMVHIQKNAHNQSRMNIQLNPAELGRVEVRLTVNNDGRTTATVLADRPETLSLLQKDSAHLEKALQNAGLQVGAQDLSFNLRGDGDTNDFKSRRRFSRHNRNDGLSIDGTQLSGAQIDAAVFSKYSVNYKA